MVQTPNRARLTACGLSALLLLAPVLTGCSDDTPTAGGPVASSPQGPTPSQSEPSQASVDPTTPAAQELTKDEVDDPSQLECVDRKFTMDNENGVEVVDAQRAYDCIKDAGQVKLKSTAATRTLNEGYVISAYGSQNDLLRFSLSDDWRDESEFGILRVRVQD